VDHDRRDRGKKYAKQKGPAPLQSFDLPNSSSIQTTATVYNDSLNDISPIFSTAHAGWSRNCRNQRRPSLPPSLAIAHRVGLEWLSA
jgi:hypothetical protein